MTRSPELIVADINDAVTKLNLLASELPLNYRVSYHVGHTVSMSLPSPNGYITATVRKLELQ